MANRQAAVDFSEIMDGFESLKEAKEPIARAMGVAMGQEVRDEAKLRAPVLKPENLGVDNQSPGQLKEAIYLAYDGRRSILTPGHFVYAVSWNAAKAPHGHLLEFGHWQYYAWEKNASGKYYTPLLEGTTKINGRNRNRGVPLKEPKPVPPSPFLGPAFDTKLAVLPAVAGLAGARKFTEIMNEHDK